MRARAKRHASEDQAYRDLRARLLGGPCEVCPAMHAAAARLERTITLVCAGRSTELNHRRKRSSAGALANPDNVQPCCHAGNQAVEHWPEVAHEAGTVVREDDPEWDALGARAWRLAQ